MWATIVVLLCSLAIHAPAQSAKASRVRPRQPDQIKEARRLLETGSTEQAITLLRQIVHGEPENPDAHLLLGTALARVPKRTEALEELRAAVQLAPKSASAHYALGTALAGFAQFEDARPELEKAVELDPSVPQAHLGLALVLGQQNQESLAQDQLETVIRLEGNSRESAYPRYLLAQILIHQNNFRSAEKELLSAISLRPTYPEAYLSLGVVRRALQNTDGSLAAFQQAAAQAPDDFSAQYEFGTALLQASHAAQAIGPLQKAVALRPEEQRAHFQLCRALQRARRLEEAQRCEQQTRELSSRALSDSSHAFEAAAANDRGMKLEKEGKLDAALEDFRTAVKLDPSQTVLRRNMALVLCRMGRWQEGANELRKVLEQDPDDAEATRALYVALDKLK